MKHLRFFVFMAISLMSVPLLSSAETATNNPLANKIEKARNGQVLLRYNDKGEVVEQYVFANKSINYNHDEIMSAQVNTFDEHHNITKSEVYNGEKLLLDTLTYKTRPNGSLLEIHSQKFPDEVTKFHYNDKNQVYILFNGPKSTKLTYLDDGRIESYIMDVEKDIKTQLIYNNEKILIATKGYSKGEHVYTVKVNYDNDGFPVSKEMFIVNDGKEEPSGQKLVYIYD